MDGSLVVADTVPVDVESGRVEHQVEVTYTPPTEIFTVELVLLDSNGKALDPAAPLSEGHFHPSAAASLANADCLMIR